MYWRETGYNHRTKWRLLALALIAVVCIEPLIVFAQLQARQITHKIVSAGIERSYLLHRPTCYNGEPIPLVLNFHGSGSVPERQLTSTDFGALADRECFAVVFPAGVFINSVIARSWNANVEPGVDDIQFARDVIAAVSANLNIDASRVYATGMSGGARMSSRLACELSDLLAAVAPVAGIQFPNDCKLKRAIPIFAIHSKVDSVNHYRVVANSPPYWRMGVETAVDQWRKANGCDSQVRINKLSATVELRTWANCAGGAEIQFQVIADGAHIWPADASERIWSFFSKYPKC